MVTANAILPFLSLGHSSGIVCQLLPGQRGLQRDGEGRQQQPEWPELGSAFSVWPLAVPKGHAATTCSMALYEAVDSGDPSVWTGPILLMVSRKLTCGSRCRPDVGS